MLLALECSSDRRSVALLRGGRIVAEAFRVGGRETPLATLVQEVLGAAGATPDAVEILAVGLGPGSYTGIRAALAFAQGWELARGVWLLGIGSAAACALRAHRQGRRGPATILIDAQRGEAYAAAVDLTDAGVTELSPLRLADRADLAQLASGPIPLIGPDLARLGLTGDAIAPDAAAVAELAQGRTDYLAAERLEPIYLRPVAFLKAPPPRHTP